MAFPVDSTYIDGNGKQVLLSDNVRAIVAVDLSGSSFWSPDSSFTGFGADGNYYENGVSTLARATWASEDAGDHRGTLNRFPQTFFAVLTDQELSLIAADTFDLFVRFIVLEIPEFPTGTWEDPDPPPVDIDSSGFFLEWVEDESLPSLGTVLGIAGDSLNDLSWAGGRLAVSSDNATRVIDFREDRAYAFRSAGHYRYRSEVEAGLESRNMPSFFGATVYPNGGPDISDAATSFTSGTSNYFIIGSATGVTVFRWTSNGIASLETVATTLGGESRGHEVTSAGELYVLIKYDDGGDRLKIIRSIFEWKAMGGGFSGSVHQLSLPLWVGGEGRLVVHGDYAYVGVGSGVWRANRFELDVVSPKLVFGKTLVAAEPVAPLYEVLTQTGDPVSMIKIDSTTGKMAVLYGNVLSLIHLGQNIVEGSYSTGPDSNPQLPASPRAIASYNFSVGEVF